MKVLIFLILALVSNVLPGPFSQSYRFTSVKCSGSSKNTTSTHFCFVKAYSRNTSTLNFGFTLTRALNTIYLKFSVDYKYGTVFHPILEPPMLEWCSFISGNSNNILMNKILDMIRDSVPGLIHKCPYQVIM